MKNKWLIAGAVAALVAFGTTVQAVPITGSINFDGGGVNLNGTSLATATAITGFIGSTVVDNFPVPTGSFAVIPTGTAVTFIASGFTFSPGLSPNPVVPLWSIAGGWSFDLTSVVSSIGVGPALNLAGSGILHGPGLSDTIGTWSFSTTGAGTTQFGFIAGNSSVPDGGMTVMLLGAALSGLALFRKKVMA